MSGVPEATLKKTDAGLVPEGDGWFVLNARDAVWWRSDGPCVIVMVRGRKAGSEVLYPVNEVAARLGASAFEETPSPREAYAPFAPPEQTRYQERCLP